MNNFTLDADVISNISTFLSLKEKAVARSLNKVWLEGATLGKYAMINPDEWGTNLDGALSFVASSFPNIQHFSFKIKQGYFLNLNNELWDDDAKAMRRLQLHGESLKSLFGNKSICLRTVNVTFGDSGTPHQNFRILVENSILNRNRRVNNFPSHIISNNK